MTLLETKNLSKIFISGEKELKAVNNINIKLAKNEVILIMGPSGSGKTTLISMIGALLEPSSGQIWLNNQNLQVLAKYQLSEIRLKSFGFIFQSFNLLAALPALENVALPAILAGEKKKIAYKKALKLLKQMGLAKRSFHLPKQLSGGERQRVAIGRALINDPKVILADEPTGNLDSKTGKEVMTLLCSIACNRNKGIIIVTHDMRLTKIADRILHIEDGKLMSEEKIKRKGLTLGKKIKK